MQEYLLTLRNDKIATYKRFSLFLFLLNTASIVFYLVTRLNGTGLSITAIVALVILLAVIIAHLMLAKKKEGTISFIIALSGIIAFWLLVGLWWVSIAMALMFYFYKMADRQLVVVINEQKVHYPSFPAKVISWNELSNLVLKDGLLTIDFKNNRIIQQPLAAESKPVDERDFNEFCLEQLSK